MSSIRTRAMITLAAGLVGSLGHSAAAQDRFFPRALSFELPEASPRVHGLAGRLLSARHGDSRFGQETEAEVALGENFPVLSLRSGSRPITLGFGSQVYARFSLSDARSSLISNDWVVGLNATALRGAWAFTVELYHESSHLGDEYRDRFNARRLDWSREVAVGWVSYRTGGWRLTSGFSYVLLDQLGLERPGVSLAADFYGRPIGGLLGDAVRPIGGVYVEGNAATAWRVSTSAKIGVTLASSTLGRDVGIALIAHDGLSTQRQFFREESRYLGLELRFDL
jgi:Protein of unknown function (DUF1207)